MENGPFSSMIYLLTIATFLSHVKLPEGKTTIHQGYVEFSDTPRYARSFFSTWVSVYADVTIFCIHIRKLHGDVC